MKVIQIEYDLQGQPTVSPDPEVCFPGEVISWVILSKNPLMDSVNLAFEDNKADFFCCSGGGTVSREYHCKVDLQVDADSPTFARCAVVWGIVPGYSEPPSKKYIITPFVNGGRYDDGELDPYIVITKRP